MAKFASIWGDLTVGNVAPAEEKKDERKKVETPENPEGDETIQTKDDKVTTEEEDVVEKVDPPKEAEEEEPEALEFDEDEIEKTYNLLVDEGVLPEPEEDDEGFDMSPTGLADAIAAVTRKNVAAEISAIPDSVQQFYAHVMDGNDPSSFKVSVPIVWADVNIEEEDAQVAALTQFYVNQGMSVDEAKEEIEDVKESGKLYKKADVAQEALIKIQTANEELRKKKATQEEKEADKKAKKEIDDLKTTIDSAETIAGFKLDTKRRKEFKEYLFKVKPRTGKTQMQENMSSEERRMNIAFLDFVDYNKADLKREVQTDLTKKRKKRLTRYSDKGVRGSNSSKSVTTKTDVNKGKIVFPSIFGTQEVDIED